MYIYIRNLPDLEEEWRPAKTIWNGNLLLLSKYEVSNLGRIRNLNGHIMAQNQNRDGYLCVGLVADGMKQHTFSVHRIVATTFIPNPENKLTVNHLVPGEEGKLVNRIDTLEWATYSEQLAYAIKTEQFSHPKGVKHFNTKMTELYIRKICEMMQDGYNNKVIKKELHVPNTGLLDDIRRKRCWKSISCDYMIPKHSGLLFSSETMHDICKLLERHIQDKEICEILDLPFNSQSKGIIQNLKHKRKYKEYYTQYNW